MAEIQVHCGSCAKKFLVSEDMAGMIATCPACERQISVPLPDGMRESRPKLQVKKEGTLTGGKRCPVCNGSMTSEALICVQCGHDTRTVQAFSEQGGSFKPAKPILALLGVIIVGGLVWSLIRMRSDSGMMGDPVPAPDSLPAPASDSSSLPDADSIVPQPLGIVGDGDAGEEPAMEEGPSLEEVQQKLAAALDARHPMPDPGTTLMLRRANGLVHRGELLAFGVDVVILKTEEAVVEVPYDALDRQSRMLCDKAFRRKYVEHRARQAMSSVEAF